MSEQLTVQALEALAKAQEVRSKRAHDKRLIKLGRKDPTLIVSSPAWWWENAQVLELLIAVDKVGRSKAMKWLLHANVPSNRKLKSLTSRQRRALVVLLDREAQRRDRVRMAMAA